MNRHKGAGRILLEVVIIVGSILLAFGIDAGWDRIQDRAAEDEVLSAIERGLERSREQIENVLNGTERRADRFSRFLQATPSELRALHADSAVVMIIGFHFAATYQPFDASLRGPDILLIEDRALREAIGDWLGQSDDLVENTPLIHEIRVEFERAVDFDALTVLTSHESLSGRPPSHVLAQWREDEDVLGLLMRWDYVGVVTARKAGDLLEATDELLAALRSGT